LAEALVGRRFYPTRLMLPAWATGLSFRPTLRKFSVQNLTVRSISPEFNLDRIPARTNRNLLRSKIFPRLPPALDSRDYMKAIMSEAPVDGKEIVGWMQLSAADNAILDARCEEYNRLGSQLVGASDDPYIPGTVIEDINFLREKGRDVSSRGYGVADTPRGRFRVDAGGRGDGIFQDLLAWGAVPWVGFTQWVGDLLKWKVLANTPIRDAVGFPNTHGLSAPQYVVLQSGRPALRVAVEQGFTTDRDQRLNLVWRDTSNFTRVLARDWIDLPAGVSELSYQVISFPYVPPAVYNMQPEDQALTRMDYLVTSP
jgi:hypothetical protein